MQGFAGTRIDSDPRSQDSGSFVMPDMRWSDASDEVLLAASPSHANAFATFYDRYETAIIGYMLRRTRNIEVAIDLASETFAAALAVASQNAGELKRRA